MSDYSKYDDRRRSPDTWRRAGRGFRSILPNLRKL